MKVSIKFDLPNEASFIPAVRQQVESLLSSMNVCKEDVDRAEIVVTEACTNVVRHAYDKLGQRYLVELSCCDGNLTMTVTDRGKGFDASSLPIPLPGQIGGYGVYCIKELADEVSFECPGVCGTRVTAEIRLSRNSVH